MATFSYDDFQNNLSSSGLASQFSAADMALAQKNADAGMSLLEAKKGYAAATTDEERQYWNDYANNIRSSYGEYTGGDDGSQYLMNTLSPGSFTYDEAPSFSGSYSGEVEDLYNQLKNYGDYSYDAEKPEYTNRWQDQIDSLIDEIVNREDFSYDASTDPLYSSYRKQYLREGKRATEDALGTAAAASAGLPSSYATTAASQTGNYYAAQLADKIPELYEIAYNKYLSDYQLKQSDLAAVQGQESTEYGRYQDELSQYNTDRDFDYQTWSDAYNRLYTALSAAETLDDSEWEKYLTELEQYNTDRSFAYDQYIDEYNSQQTDLANQWDQAETAANYGDYSWLEDLGIDTSNNLTEREYAEEIATLLAENGDPSMLEELYGFDATQYLLNYALQNEASSLSNQKAAAALGTTTSSGSSSSGSGSGSSSSKKSSSGSSSSGSSSSDTGIVSSMLALGDDTLAYEYLVGISGLTNAEEDKLWELYEAAKGTSSSVTDTSGKSYSTPPSAPTSSTKSSTTTNDSATVTSLRNLIKQNNALAKTDAEAASTEKSTILKKIDEAYSSGKINDATANSLANLLGT